MKLYKPTKIFTLALEKFIYKQNEIKKMNTPTQQLSPEERDKIRKAHHTSLSKIDKAILESDCLSSQDKQDVMTELQNRVNLKIEAEIYVKETQLNN